MIALGTMEFQEGKIVHRAKFSDEAETLELEDKVAPLTLAMLMRSVKRLWIPSRPSSRQHLDDNTTALPTVRLCQSFLFATYCNDFTMVVTRHPGLPIYHELF